MTEENLEPTKQAPKQNACTPRLPDPAICRARQIGNTGVYECLVEKPHRCPVVMMFGIDFHCLHVDRKEIAARTQEAEKHGTQ